jgi:ABC-2 type transport system permease protein
MSKPLSRSSALKSTGDTLLAMAHKELTIMVRYPVEFVASFGQIFLIVAIFSLAGLTFSPSQVDAPDSGPSGIVVYGFILFVFFSDTVWTLGYQVRQEQVQGTLEQLYLSPANKFANLVARVTTILLWTGLLSIAAVALMTLMLGRLPFENPLLGGYLLITALSGTFGIGFAFAALTLRIKEAAQSAAILLQFGFLILCANFFPFAALPAGLRMVARIIPLAYAVDGLRSTLMGYPEGFPELAPIEVEIIIVTAFGILMPILGYHLYRRAEYQARVEGGLADY